MHKHVAVILSLIEYVPIRLQARYTHEVYLQVEYEIHQHYYEYPP